MGTGVFLELTGRINLNGPFRLLTRGLGRNIAVGAGVTLLIQVGGTGLSYVLEIVLARLLKADNYGIYTYVLAWVSLLAIPAGLGFGTSLLRYVGSYNHTTQIGLLKGVVLRGWQLVLGTGVFLAVVAISSIKVLQPSISIPYAAALTLGLWLVPVQAVQDIQVSIGRGLGTMTLAFLPKRIVQPLLLIAALVVAGFASDKVSHHVALKLTLGAAAVAVCGQGLVIACRVFWGGHEGVRTKYRTRQWLQISLPMVLIAGFMLLLGRTDVLMLGILGKAVDVGAYNAATRTASLATLLLAAVNAVAAPTIAQLYEQSKQEELQRLAGIIAHLAFWPSALIVMALITLAPVILGMFGQEFLGAQVALVVLAIGNLLNVGAGSVGYFMNMTGNQNVMALLVGSAAVVNIGLNWIAIPVLGMTGAALATALSTGLWNLFLNRAVVSRLGIRPSIVHAVKEILSTK